MANIIKETREQGESVHHSDARFYEDRGVEHHFWRLPDGRLVGWTDSHHRGYDGKTTSGRDHYIVPADAPTPDPWRGLNSLWRFRVTAEEYEVAHRETRNE